MHPPTEGYTMMPGHFFHLEIYGWFGEKEKMKRKKYFYFAGDALNGNQ